jgi:putative intracellular protease/amidase
MRNLSVTIRNFCIAVCLYCTHFGRFDQGPDVGKTYCVPGGPDNTEAHWQLAVLRHEGRQCDAALPHYTAVLVAGGGWGAEQAVASQPLRSPAVLAQVTTP